MIPVEKLVSLQVDGKTFQYRQPGWWCSLEDPNDLEGQLVDEDNLVAEMARRTAEAMVKGESFTPLLIRAVRIHCGLSQREAGEVFGTGEKSFEKYDVTAYSNQHGGDLSPLAVTTDMGYVSGIARDSSGRIYVTNEATNTVTVYPSGSNGNVEPLAVIGGSNTKLASPVSIALGATGQIYVANSVNYPKGAINIYPPLGAETGIINEAPIAIIAGDKNRPE